VLGAAAWTVVNLFCAAFVAARRAGRYLSLQTLVSAAKLVVLVPLALAGAGAAGLVEAWVASAVLGVFAGWRVRPARHGAGKPWPGRARSSCGAWRAST
jgi:O-antigen/teichoic acid export membrane protein